MASRDNVFSVFENYVNKGKQMLMILDYFLLILTINSLEDVSFQFDDIPNTTDSSKEQIMSSENSEEIIDIEENIKISSRARRTKKRHVVQEQYNSSNDSIDLTEFSPPIKSKRLKERAGEAIDLCEPSSEIVPPPKKGRSNKSGVKARKVSYKKALAASHLPLPAIDKPSKAKEVVQIIQNVMPAVLPPVEQQNTEEMYDLTGDVELTSEHSSAPLFQKSNDHAGTPTVIIKEHNTSQEFDYDFDSISVNVKINGKISKFVHKSADLRFYDLFKTISQKEKVAIDNIFIFNEKEKRILPDETPKGVGHSISAIYSKAIRLS